MLRSETRCACAVATAEGSMSDSARVTVIVLHVENSQQTPEPECNPDRRTNPRLLRSARAKLSKAEKQRHQYQ